tara:strand:+ start:182 stop:1243 length:1062 start_codon:yes stop_codon:yes gene_type:complete
MWPLPPPTSFAPSLHDLGWAGPGAEILPTRQPSEAAPRQLMDMDAGMLTVDVSYGPAVDAIDCVLKFIAHFEWSKDMSRSKEELCLVIQLDMATTPGGWFVSIPIPDYRPGSGAVIGDFVRGEALTGTSADKYAQGDVCPDIDTTKKKKRAVAKFIAGTSKVLEALFPDAAPASLTLNDDQAVLEPYRDADFVTIAKTKGIVDADNADRTTADWVSRFADACREYAEKAHWRAFYYEKLGAKFVPNGAIEQSVRRYAEKMLANQKIRERWVYRTRQAADMPGDDDDEDYEQEKGDNGYWFSGMSVPHFTLPIFPNNLAEEASEYKKVEIVRTTKKRKYLVDLDGSKVLGGLVL